MKKIKYISSFLFFLFCFMLQSDNVFAIPATGGFYCTYDIKYNNIAGSEDHANFVVSYGTYEGSNGKEGLTKKIVDASNTVNVDISLAHFANSPVTSKAFDFSKVDVAKFYDSKSNKWVCPKIRYVIWSFTANPYEMFLYAGEGSSDLNDYNKNKTIAEAQTGNFGEAEASIKKITDPSNEENNGNGDSNIITCNPVKTDDGTLIVMEINRNTNVAYFTIDGHKANEIPNYTSGCKDSMDTYLNYCKYKFSTNGDHSKDIVTFGKTCIDYLSELGINYNDYDYYRTKNSDTISTDANGEIVDASDKNGDEKLQKLTWEKLGEDVDLGCSDKDVKALMEDITRYYRLIEVMVPILIILFGSIDLTKGVLNQDRDAMQKVIQAFIKRCIAGLAIYFLPLIIEVVFSLPGLPDSNQILCGIAMIFR